MNMGLVLAVCGMPASGKGEFATVLSNSGVPVCSMGDMIRSEVIAREIEESPRVFGEVAAELRAQHGDGVLASRLVEVVNELLIENNIVLIEGMRGSAERDIFQLAWGDDFQVVAIVADTETRFARIQSRGRSQDGNRTDFEIRNQREEGWGLDKLIVEAEHKFSNNGELTTLIDNVSNWFDRL